MPLILPPSVEVEKFILHVFTLEANGRMNLVGMFPQPVNNIFQGATLTQIKQAIQEPIDGLLSTAKQTKGARLIFEVVEINAFNQARIKQATMQSLRQSAGSTNVANNN